MDGTVQGRVRDSVIEWLSSYIETPHLAEDFVGVHGRQIAVLGNNNMKKSNRYESEIGQMVSSSSLLCSLFHLEWLLNRKFRDDSSGGGGTVF